VVYLALDIFIFQPKRVEVVSGVWIGKEEMGDRIYAVTDSGLLPLEIRSEHYYTLRARERRGHPILEINGVHMHSILSDPWLDALMRVKAARVSKGMKVLDTCTGLGYTAIAALKMGAEVVTVELRPEVLILAEWNPWSEGLEDATIILGDVTKIIENFDDETFDRIIHDPPAITIAGELYSRQLYREFFRVLKAGGYIYHYTGETGKRRGIDVTRGVMNRLREVGFEEVRKVKKVQGVVAKKPKW
jgi:predicted methyltransferase